MPQKTDEALEVSGIIFYSLQETCFDEIQIDEELCNREPRLPLQWRVAPVARVEPDCLGKPDCTPGACCHECYVGRMEMKDEQARTSWRPCPVQPDEEVSQYLMEYRERQCRYREIVHSSSTPDEKIEASALLMAAPVPHTTLHKPAGDVRRRSKMTAPTCCRGRTPNEQRLLQEKRNDRWQIQPKWRKRKVSRRIVSDSDSSDE